MTWTYDPTDLTTTTESGRVNSVRLFLGDTDTGSQQVQDEEVLFALSESGDNVYNAAALLAKVLATKYSQRVDTELDGALKAKYSQISKNYRTMAQDLKREAVLRSGTGLGISAGGISPTEMYTVSQLTTRVKPSFTSGQFANDAATSDSEDSGSDYY